MDTFADGRFSNPRRPAGARKTAQVALRSRGLMALGLIGLSIVAVGPDPGGGRPDGSPVYAEEYVAGDGASTIAVVPVEGTIAAADNTLGGTQPTATPEGLQTPCARPHRTRASSR